VIKISIRDFLESKINKRQIEKIVLDNGYIEYRIWSLSTISYDGKITSCGRKCVAKYLATPDDMGLYFNDNMYIKDERNEYYTEDFNFYEDLIGINPKQFIGLVDDEFYKKVNEKIKGK
jgi:hypothetical protein